MRDLIESVFISAFGGPGLAQREDQARLPAAGFDRAGSRIAFTTDSYVVTPLEFPGGDIGRIAVCGAVNDLAVGGARPCWLSAAFIIEEGTEIDLLHRIAGSMASAADEADVAIVTGDTKVVERGAADGLFITTSGIGIIPPGRDLSAARVRPGDVILVNGAIGDHGAAILAAREDLALTARILSDAKPLNALMERVAAASPGLRAARDTTRGGVATVLNEIADAARVGLEIREQDLPLRDEVRGICELLGLDPLYLANEGGLVLFVPPAEGEAALAAMRQHPAGRDARLIGHAVAKHPGTVVMTTPFGGGRIVDMLVGQQLPRIC